MSLKAILNITVSPRSSKNRVAVDGSGDIKVYLTASPVDGKANAALLNFLSKTLDITKSKIKIISGEKNKKKRLQIEDIAEEELLSRMRKG
jgi:uncharacterized protein